MKVLFAVSNESISDSIIKKYQQEYKEIISSKNVYYFNAITKELQKDKTYDRIVISEDLEPFANNNYEVIDKFIFEKLDSISDEATSNNGQDIPIILICADRRGKSESLLVKIFGIGIYSALLGQDRSVSKVCELINKPRSKKDAKIYYRIESDDVDYKSESDGDVSEIEIQNILNHYKRLGKNEEQYVTSFDNIAAQYTDAQLRVICRFLPLNVKAVLEANSQKYQELITFGNVTSGGSTKVTKQKPEKYVPNEDYQKQNEKKKAQKIEEPGKLDIIEKNIGKSNLTKPVVIPSTRNIDDVKKVNIASTPSMASNIPTQTAQMPQNFEAARQDNQTMQTAVENNVGAPQMNMKQNIQEVPQADSRAQEEAPQMPGMVDEPSKEEQANDTYDAFADILSVDEQKTETLPGFEDVNVNTNMSGTSASVGIEANGEAPKKKRGRPRKVQPQEAGTLPGFEDINTNMSGTSAGTGVGANGEAPKKKRGRPRKVQPQEAGTLPGFENINTNANGSINLFDLGNETEMAQNKPSGGIILPGFDDEDDEPVMPGVEQEPVAMPQSEPQVESQNIPSMQNNDNVVNATVEESFVSDFQNANNMNVNSTNTDYNQGYVPNNQNYVPNNASRDVENTNGYQSVNLDSLLTRDKKMVAFVGTSKNGTSFLVNNLAEVMSRKGVRTAILDLTKNKNAYYIYTQNEEELRKKAFSCVQNLRNGIADGIQVNKNLVVYTTLPDESDDLEDYENVLKTLAQNYSLVLMDCDFDTNYAYFKYAQEIYLVQSFDILTIQPLTAFLRDLKSKNILDPEKLRIVLNKVLRVRSVTERTIIGGVAYYNDPAMSFMTELFNKDTIKYCTIPFEEQTYSRYLEGLVNCQISTNGYSKNFMSSLEKLSNMVYPLLSGNAKVPYTPNNNFSNSMNNTLDRMKKF